MPTLQVSMPIFAAHKHSWYYYTWRAWYVFCCICFKRLR